MKSGSSSESLNEQEEQGKLKRSLTIEINAIKPSLDHDADDEEEYVFNRVEKISRSVPFQKRYKKYDLNESNLNENTRLLSKSSRSPTAQSPTRILNYLSIAEIESQHARRQEKKRVFRLMFSSILLALTIILAAVFGFTSQSVQDPDVFGIKIVTRSISLFEFNLDIIGLNYNLIPIVFTPDLDVYASRSRPDGSWSATTKIIANQELLGHVRTFNSSSALPPVATTTISSKISIIDPSNTLGKFIYMTTPFVLTVRGFEILVALELVSL